MIRETFYNTIKKHNLICPNDVLLVGISGGPDSVCLLHLLSSISKELNLTLFAIHINHNLRGKESELDKEYVYNFCKQLNIPLFIREFDIKSLSLQSKCSIEETARKVRYDEFSSLAIKINASKIVVAHNKNDQCETLLLNLIRGTGLDGLTGMNYMRNNIIRPLLDIDRTEIELYCNINSLNPRIDSSNLESIYTRNKIRLDLIPHINKNFNININNNLFKLSLLLKDEQDFIENFSFEVYKKCLCEKNIESLSLNVLLLLSNHIAVIKRVLRLALKDLKGNLTNITNIHIEKIYLLIKDGRTSSEIHLPSNIYVKKSYDRVIFSLYKTMDIFKPFYSKISIPGTTTVENFGKIESVIQNTASNVEIFKEIKYNSLVQFFDYSKIKNVLTLRTRQEGDFIKPLKSKGTKKLKKYFIDEKIPLEKRNKLPLVADGSEIIWIIGYKINDNFKVTENTKEVLKLIYHPTSTNNDTLDDNFN